MMGKLARNITETQTYATTSALFPISPLGNDWGLE